MSPHSSSRDASHSGDTSDWQTEKTVQGSPGGEQVVSGIGIPETGEGVLPPLMV